VDARTPLNGLVYLTSYFKFTQRKKSLQGHKTHSLSSEDEPVLNLIVSSLPLLSTLNLTTVTLSTTIFLCPK